MQSQKEFHGFDYLPPKAGCYDPANEKDACGVGFIADLEKRQTHKTVVDALKILTTLQHRGGCGCEEETGDGAGLLCNIPHEFFVKVAKETFGVALKEKKYAVGNFFFSRDDIQRENAKRLFAAECAQAGHGLQFLGWRRLPVCSDVLGPTSRSFEPVIEQAFVVNAGNVPLEEFEAALFVLRKKTQNKLFTEGIPFYPCSLSCRVIVYKGMLTAEQVTTYHPDLQDADFKAHVAMVHSRFSTNTFPSWSRAHPYRYVCHNGEINSVRGNINWMDSREAVMHSEKFGAGFSECFPIVEYDQSDSGRLDNVLEALIVGGKRSIPEAMTLLVPEAWQNAQEYMEPYKRDYYKYCSAMMEPWDGPAMIAFTDGDFIGATLDRNGLRPCRFYVTKDNRIIGGSEAGCLPVEPENVARKWRLQPGKMFVADFNEHRIIDDGEFKETLCKKHPFGEWMERGEITFARIAEHSTKLRTVASEAVSLPHMKAMGYTVEALDLLIRPCLSDGMEPLGSMGNDTPLACLSEQPRLVFDYFHQLFAQVTNPPLDPIRESVVMSLACYVGPERDILADPSAEHCKRLYLEDPTLDAQQFDLLLRIHEHAPHLGWRSKVIDTTYEASEGPGGLAENLRRICAEASEAVRSGHQIIVLSDRLTSADRVHMPALMVAGSVHHHLVAEKSRLRVALILETGEAFEVHHFCLLAGFGADAWFSWGMFQAMEKLKADDAVGEKKLEDYTMIKNMRKAIGKGMLKVMAKMGVSTLHSYKGAQIFECVGLSEPVIDMCFKGTASRVSGCGFNKIGKDYLRLHHRGWPEVASLQKENFEGAVLPNPGDYHYRNPDTNKDAEKHINDPEAIAQLQVAARNNSREAYATFSQAHNHLVGGVALRGQLDFLFESADSREAVPLEEVEPASEIVKRFRTGAMSYGSISMESHSTLALAMNRIGGKSNTGEGGEDPERWEQMTAEGSMRSSIKQVASGRFGVTIEYLVNSDETQIKMAQGAKPGEGGELPGKKVNELIAKTRHSTPGVGLISPPPHHDIYSIEDLAELIYDLKSSNPRGNVSVKLVSEAGVGVVAAGVAKGKADHILVSGYDGGTGASRWTGIKHAGLPWELGIAETHQTLVLNGLRGRVQLETDGGIRNGRDVLIAALLGAEQYGLATAPLIAMGCIMMRKCHLNTCPVGIATQDPVLRAKFEGKPEHVVNYLMLVAEETRTLLARLGFRSINEAVGRADRLTAASGPMKLWRESMGLDLNLECITAAAHKMEGAGLIGTVDSIKVQNQDHQMEKRLDMQLLKQAEPVFADPSKRVEIHAKVTNVDRAVGTTLSSELVRQLGRYVFERKEGGVSPQPDGIHVEVKLQGSAGQSLGAFLAKGVRIEVEGDSNDYCGKGLSGGHVTVFPPKESTFDAEKNMIIGNVALYGATAGKAFFRGVAAERFCVRNSGAQAVVEGVGDHGCEYMTGGVAVVLGPTGINFAAGMSGGLAFIYSPGEDREHAEKEFKKRCNMEMVEFFPVGQEEDDEALLQGLLSEHKERTGSTVASRILSNWADEKKNFIKVYPTDFRLVREEMRAKEAQKAKQAPEADNLSDKATTNEGGDTASDSSSPKEGKRSLAASAATSIDIEDMKPKRPDTVEKPIKLRGFIEYERGPQKWRNPKERVGDFNEIYIKKKDIKKLQTQAARCMDCGIPFCQSKPRGCPLGNFIPEWNCLVRDGHWKAALGRLLATNNFPEFTGRVCPAPCEGSCTLGIIDDPVTIKNIECEIIDRAFANGWMIPSPPPARTGKKVAIIGSGPAGMAAADQLNKMGHSVTVFERADRPGGLMTYGVPNMKADKEDVVLRRVRLMEDEGVKFVCGTAGAVGKPGGPTADALKREFDTVLLATGSTVARDLNVPGREATGIHKAMDYLTTSTQTLLSRDDKTGERKSYEAEAAQIHAKGKKVVVLGGGDTGTDCIGTAIRQGAVSVKALEIMPQPPAKRAAHNPWPQWPLIFRKDYGHQEREVLEGSDPRQYLMSTKEFIKGDNGEIKGLKVVQVEWQRESPSSPWKMAEVPGSEEVYEADLVLLALGFLHPEKTLAEQFGIRCDNRGNYLAQYGQGGTGPDRNGQGFRTNVEGIFAAGDCRRGQSLVVWAITEGRMASDAVNEFLCAEDPVARSMSCSNMEHRAAALKAMGA
uniref:glutamate synthase (NADH) n=1 Tax=Chromera velia CCMP2878 TaxID=1169474 RepID=A0A0G4HSB6_9ALVE|eukprot:Cvel_8240.t1-p1 / transcript=Cvel_8240.t1 / gene=Cvel_8240 / organism=Chromera_velia_CCMP2878 / gene_product=Glutamate synthase 1 [NADH], chloroplastic, putative / transcript_product=Glutamate synthase 1 [NADH], chloroplastic, putative / location=Cvel_scaffold450:49418-60429(-) / protein_length=2160 / sequence_SO=supercontig / SO=protein_coding / is_pseudo=false